MPRRNPSRAPIRAPIVICVTGPSGSGKTTLIASLLREIRAAGVRVSAMKHASHGFDMDRPGKDTWRMRAAGAEGVLAVGAGSLALLAEASPHGAEGRHPDPVRLAARFLGGSEIVLAEGFGWSAAPRVEVIASEPKPAAPGAGPVIAWALRREAPPAGAAGCERGPIAVAGEIPVFDAGDAASLAGFLLHWTGAAGTRRPSGLGPRRAGGSAREAIPH